MQQWQENDPRPSLWQQLRRAYQGWVAQENQRIAKYAPPQQRSNTLQDLQDITNVMIGLVPYVGGKPFRTDEAGKIHTDIPDHIPENWGREQHSIRTRKAELDYNSDAIGGHQDRLQREQKFLDQVNAKLSVNP